MLRAAWVQGFTTRSRGTVYSMDFSSDNITGASAPILQAMIAANAGPAAPLRQRRNVPGSGASALRPVRARGRVPSWSRPARAPMRWPWRRSRARHGGLLPRETHVIEDECGAPEFFIGGAKLVGIAGRDGKITPEGLRDTLTRFPRGVVRQVQPAAAIPVPGDRGGTVYSPTRSRPWRPSRTRPASRSTWMGALRQRARDLGRASCGHDLAGGCRCTVLRRHQERRLGLRGGDLLRSRGRRRFLFRRKRGGHTLSKGRLLGVQMNAYLEADWLDLARQANAGGAACRGLWPLARPALSLAAAPTKSSSSCRGGSRKRLRAAGARFYPWGTRSVAPADRPGPDEVLARFVCSFETADEAVERCLAIAEAVA